MNITGSRGNFSGLLPASLGFNLRKQVGDPPALAKAGFFHPLHQRRVGVGGRDFRRAFLGRRRMGKPPAPPIHGQFPLGHPRSFYQEHGTGVRSQHPAYRPLPAT